jgi:ABC-type protease/lipase transport system fused ATPase/permease subunit
MKKPNNFTNTVQYPVRDHYHNEQSWQDVRLAYDRIYELEHQVRGLHEKMNAPKSTEKAPAPKINGLNVRAVPPMQGRTVANLNHLPVLAYNPASGEIEWTIPTP